jgi:hypothetical protein
LRFCHFSRVLKGCEQLSIMVRQAVPENHDNSKAKPGPAWSQWLGPKFILAPSPSRMDCLSIFCEWRG